MDHDEITPSHQWQQHEPHLRSVAERLLGCSNAADDLLQDAWLVARLRPPRENRSPRGWLVTVLRSLAATRSRDDHNRRQREQRVAAESGDAIADPAGDIPETEALLLRYVEALGPKYSRPLYLRYWEDRSPEAIAEELGIPVSTVHSRLKWGRTKLRSRIQARGDWKGRVWSALGLGRRKWALRLATPIGAIGAVGIALVGAEVFSQESAAPAAKPLDPIPVARAEALLPLPPSAEQVVPADTARSTVAQLEVTARLEHSGAPAEGVDCRFERVSGAPDAESHVGRTGPLGAFDLELEAGTWRLHPDRGESVELSLVAGEEHAIELIVPRGETVTGLAKRRGESLADAYIWLSWPDDPASIRVVGRADVYGNFRLEGVDPRAWIGASSKPDHLSLLQHLDTPRHRAKGWSEVVLNGGGLERTFRGRIVDPHGRPVAGAHLEIRRAGGDAGWNGLSESESITRLEGRVDRSWKPAPKRSDEQGEFEFRFSTIRYAAYLTVRAEGFATFDGLLDGGESTVVLEPEARARGQVLDPGGRPVPGARVLAECLSSGAAVETRTDASGAFALDGLAAGDVRLEVRSQRVGSHGFAELAFAADPVRVNEWQVRLSDSGSLLGRAVDSLGQPLVGWKVEAHLTTTPATDPSPLSLPDPWSRATTDRDGRFVFVHATDPSYRLSLHPVAEEDRLPECLLDGARPDGAPVSLALPEHRPARLHGTLLDARGESSSGSVILESVASGHRQTFRVETGGAITCDGLPPGTYRVHAWPWSGVPSLVATVSLMADQSLDLGPVATPAPSTVTLRFQKEDGSWMTKGSVSISSSTGLSTFRPLRETGVLELELPPETYDICFRSGGQGQADGQLVVPAGEALDATFPVVPAQFPAPIGSRRGR